MSTAGSGSEEGAAGTLPMNDGRAHPVIGFGTYKVGFVPASASGAASGAEASGAQGPSAVECVGAALGAGYRFLDCAEFYGNEAEVGKAIAASGVPRADLFLASKVWTTTIYAGRGAVRAQVERTLRDLQTDYLDLYCVHWPVPGKHVEAYLELQELCAQGVVRSLGVSNYCVEDYEELVADPRVTIPPAVNQIEVNPFLYRKRTVGFFQERGVVVQSYRSLRDGKAFGDPTVLRIAQKHGKTPAQVLGRWCLAKRCVYIPKSVSPARMAENRDVFCLPGGDGDGDAGSAAGGPGGGSGDEVSDRVPWVLDGGDVAALDALTTPENLDAFEALYRKCVNRDTPLAGTEEGVKAAITKD